MVAGRLGLFALAVLSVGFTGCSSAEPTQDPAAGCAAGETTACACDGGATGAATCDGGSFGACVCDGAGGSGGGTGGHGGGAGGQGGAGGGGGGGAGGAGGEGGAGGAGGGGGSVAVEPVCSQVPDCESSLRNTVIDRICTPDGCVDAGLRDEGTSELQRGTVQVYGKIDRMIPTQNIRSYLLRVYHPAMANGLRLTCDHILDTPEEPDVNLVRRVTADVGVPGDQIPTQASNLPVNDLETPFLVHLSFYATARDSQTGDPSGEPLGVGCFDTLIVPEGDFVFDEAHVFQLDIYPPAP